MGKKETLLERAKGFSLYNYKRKIIVTKEHSELAVSWMKGEITLSQVNRALEKKASDGNTLYHIAIWLKDAYKRKKIIIN